MGSQLFDEALTTLRVGITAIHEAVDERRILQAIFLGDVAELEQVVERRVNAAVRSQTHEVDVLAILLRIREGRDDFLILQDTSIGTSAVDLHEVLINDTARTDVQVTYFRVTHLTVGQTYVLAARLEL